jgi:hypothetical protein
MLSAWLHRRWSRRLALLAAGALDEPERARVETHVGRCPTCALEVADYRHVWSAWAEEPSATADLPEGAAERLRIQVARRLDALGARPERSEPRVRPLALAAVATFTVAAVTLSLWYGRIGGNGIPRVEAEPTVHASAVALERMESRLARDRAARYLVEARDVLVHLASEAPHCDRRGRRVDVEAETQRSRDLLARRALIVDPSTPEMASARNVLEEVERTLRDVAALDPCADPEALLELRRDLTRGRLLMKIDLVSQELMG